MQKKIAIPVRYLQQDKDKGKGDLVLSGEKI